MKRDNNNETDEPSRTDDFLEKAFRKNRTIKLVAVAIGTCVVFLVPLLAFTSLGDPHYATDAELEIWMQNKGDGKVIVLPCRFGGIAQESASGYRVDLVLKRPYSRLAVWMPRESDHPKMKFGDLIYATLRYSDAGIEVVKIRKQ